MKTSTIRIDSQKSWPWKVQLTAVLVHGEMYILPRNKGCYFQTNRLASSCAWASSCSQHRPTHKPKMNGSKTRLNVYIHTHTPASRSVHLYLKINNKTHHHATCSPQCHLENQEWNKVAYQLVITFGHVTFRRASRVFPILTRPLHIQRTIPTEGVDQPRWNTVERHCCEFNLLVITKCILINFIYVLHPFPLDIQTPFVM